MDEKHIPYYEKNTLSLKSIKTSKLPTPYPVLLSEALDEEQEKRLTDPSAPLEAKTHRLQTFDLPLMSKLMLPTANSIRAVNRLLKERGVTHPDKLMKLPSEQPGFSKLSITEQLLLNAGFIAQVPGTSQYAYLPFARRVLEKLENIIMSELLDFGYQRMEVPSFLEKSYMDKWFRSTTHLPESEDHLEADHPLVAYYSLYDSSDKELIVSPAIYEYYSDVIGATVRLKQQLPIGLFQSGKKFRDMDDHSALAVGSTNIDHKNQHIAQKLLTEVRQKQKRLRQLLQDEDASEEDILKAQMDLQSFQQQYAKSQSVADGTLVAREYFAINAISFHGNANDAHQMYKTVLEMYSSIFKKLNITGLQVEGDGSRINSELSHEYHIVIPAVNSPAVKEPTTCTHALLQCGLCGYAANTEKTRFAVQDQFDQATHLSRMKTGNLTVSMRNDPRSFGMFESSSSGDPNFDREIRSKMTSMIKLMMPNLVRRDVPVVANVVKLHFANTDSNFSIDYANVPSEDRQFINHSLILIRADRELNERSVASHFGCSTVEVLPASEAALLLLKFQKYKQKQHEKRVKAGEIEDDDLHKSYNIYQDVRDRQFAVDDSYFKAMYKDLDNVELLEREQIRIRQEAAQRDVQGGLIIVTDNTLIATGIDVDDEGMMSQRFLETDNVDRTFGIETKTQQSSSKSLIESMTGVRSPEEYTANNIVPPEYAREFEIILGGIKKGIINLDKDGEISLNVPDGFESLSEFETVSETELEGEDHQDDSKLRDNVIDIHPKGSTKPVKQVMVKGMKVYNDSGETDPTILFREAVNRYKRWDSNLKASDDERDSGDEIKMFKNESGDIVDQDGNILPHITTDLRANHNVNMAFGKKGYDDLYGDHRSESTLLGDESVTSAINPGQGDFTSPLPGDRCVQKQCQGQGVLDGVRSIEVGKTYFLGDSISKHSNTTVVDDDGKEHLVHSTAYKIGVSRLMHAIVESIGHDSHGIIWPELIAPYHVSIIIDPSSQVAKQSIRPEDGLDIYNKYQIQAQKAEKQHLMDRIQEKKRLMALRESHGISNQLVHERNKLIDQAIEAVNIDDAASMPQFGIWDWGIADNHTHAINIAGKIAQMVPGLDRQVVYDDRLDMTLDERLQDSFAIGIPWILVIDDLMQKRGLVKMVNRSSKVVEYLSVDQVIHLFNGQRPIEERLEHDNTEFERAIKYKVESAILAHFGKKTLHDGDPESLKIDQKKKVVFDYNTHVSYKSSYVDDGDSDEENNHDAMSNFNELNKQSGQSEPDQSLSDIIRRREEAEREDLAVKDADIPIHGLTASKSKTKKNAAKLNDVVDLHSKDEDIDEVIRESNQDEEQHNKLQLESSLSRLAEQSNVDAAFDDTQSKDYQGWYDTIKKLRGPLPVPTNVEIDRMFRAGVLFKDNDDIVRLNPARAENNPHVVLGVEEHVVKQYRRGNLIRLPGENGALQILDRDAYLREQQKLTGLRIEREIKEGHFSVHFQDTLEKINNKERAIRSIEEKEAMDELDRITQEHLNEVKSQHDRLLHSTSIVPDHPPQRRSSLGLSNFLSTKQREAPLITKAAANDSFDVYKKNISEPSRQMAKKGVVFRNVNTGHAEYFATRPELRVDRNDVKNTAFQPAIPGNSVPRGSLLSDINLSASNKKF